MNCAGCGRELVAHEVAIFEAIRRHALSAGAGPIEQGVCEDCSTLPCCVVCDRPFERTWPIYECATVCRLEGRRAMCCSATCLQVHAQRHHRSELAS